MSITRPELPSGYTWQEVPQMRAAFPMPNGWFYRYEEASGTLAAFITKESLEGQERFTDLEGAKQFMKTGQGFHTGLAVNVFDRVSRRVGVAASRFARKLIDDNPYLISQGRINREERNGLVVIKGRFRSGSQILASKGMPPISWYLQTIGNDRTDKTYLIHFETPEALWEQDQETAQIMVNNSVIDPTF